MEAPPKRRFPRLILASGALAVLVGGIYGTLPTSLAAVFIWPMTIWVAAGLFLIAIAIKTPARIRLIVASVWLVLWFWLDDQPWAFLPKLPDSARGEITRIVSLNCAGGDLKAAEEAAATGADLILLQESPSRADLEALRASLGREWTAVNGPDGSVLARGPAKRIPLPRGTHNFVAVEWGGALVVSLRLQPPIFRLDYWSPECWQAFAQNRESRMAELREVMAWVRANRGSRDVIIGGDFNSPPDRFLMADLEPIANDAFAVRGRGWGATAINAFPLVRIDQIWVDRSFVVTAAWAQTSRISDHRMVIVTVYRPT